MSSVGYNKFLPSEDQMLREYAEQGMPIAEQAMRLCRPEGSIKSRRRILGISKSRSEEQYVAPQSPVHYEHEPTLTFVAVLMCFLLFGIGVTILGEL